MSYSSVLNAVRKDLVLGHLQNRKNSVETVATLLGYTTPTSFTRWFSGEYGTSPMQWKKSHR